MAKLEMAKLQAAKNTAKRFILNNILTFMNAQVKPLD